MWECSACAQLQREASIFVARLRPSGNGAPRMAKKNTIDWQLSPAPGSTDHFTLKSEYDLFIGG